MERMEKELAKLDFLWNFNYSTTVLIRTINTVCLRKEGRNSIGLYQMNRCEIAFALMLID